MTRELIIDSFAGGGGASLGIELATGRSPDVAINHDADAIRMHAANHPSTKHFTEDVWKVSPTVVTRGRRVGLLWASPDCKHFSRAKGSKPVNKTIRSLAWVVCKWAAEARPRVIVLENVREFADWGPVVPRWRCSACQWSGTEGQLTLARINLRCPRCESRRVVITEDLVPCPDRKGLTFRRFVGRLRNLGYRVEWKVLNAADFGAPTHRRRLFLIGRRDGKPIEWPEPTHCDPRKVDEADLFSETRKPWRTAAECIDWSLPCPSIFERKKPLAEKTLRRIALGIQRYVIDNPRPFVVQLGHGGGGTFDDSRSKDTAAPLGTIHAGGFNHALVTPYLATLNHSGPEFRGQHLGRPMPTLTASRDAHGLIAPTLIQVGYGEREGQAPRSLDLDKPLGTAVAGGQKHAMVAAFLAKFRGESKGSAAAEPMPTITSGAGAKRPAGAAHALAACMVHLNHGEKQWSGVDEPARTITTGNHAFLVYSFLTKYFGTGCGIEVDKPAPTTTTKDRFGLVTVTVAGEPFVIADIGLRMLTPRELARAQGFPDDYKLTGSNSVQVARIGNSVCPPIARAIVAANYKPARSRRKVGV